MRGVVAGLALAGCVLGGCAIETDGSPPTSAALSPSSSTPTTFPSAAPPSGRSTTALPGFPSTVTALQHRVDAAVDALRSVHVTASGTIATSRFALDERATLSHGALDRLRLTGTIDRTHRFEVRCLGGDVLYAKVLASAQRFGKPWVALSPATTDRTLHLSYLSLRAQADLGIKELEGFVDAATGLSVFASQTDRTFYRLTVSTARLPKDLRGDFDDLGIDELPVGLSVNTRGLPLDFIERTQTRSGRVSVDISYDDFDEPVHVTAPPPSQVATK